jgi:hypothetical protein
MRRTQFAAAWIVAGWLATMPGTAEAGAWAQPQGHYYAKLSGIFYSADEVFDDMGKRTSMGMDADTFDGRQSFLYVEYGLRHRLTLIGQMNAGVLTDENRLVRSETTGIGDVEVGAKYQLLDKPIVLSPMISIKVPTGYNAYYEPPMGTGEFDGDARLLLSRSLYPLPLYASLDLTYRIRGGVFSNQRIWGAEVGATPHPRWFAKVLAGGTNTLVSGPGADLGVVGASTQVSEGDFTRIGANVAVNIAGRVWLDLLYERVVDGENVGAGSSLGFGLSITK